MNNESKSITIQSICQSACQAGCEESCENGCEYCDICEFCEFGCEVDCQSSSDAITCEVGCEVNCETYCESNCQASCELACETSCQYYCENGCEYCDICEFCEYGCEVDCQGSSDVPCQIGCEVNCEKCDSCDTYCDTCDSCDTSCNNCNSCDTYCDVCDSCDTSCNNCDSCDTYCDVCDSCDTSCDSCDSCDTYCNTCEAEQQPEQPNIQLISVDYTWIKIRRYVNDSYTDIRTYASLDNVFWNNIDDFTTQNGYAYYTDGNNNEYLTVTGLPPGKELYFKVTGTKYSITVESAIIYAKTYYLQYGSTGDEVTLLQQNLQTLGYDCSITGTFGSETESNVRTFQELVGISVDGIVGPETYSHINSVLSNKNAGYISIGMIGTDVQKLQQDLSSLGYNCGRTDGKFDINTKNAVMLFQQSKGLSQSGVVDNTTKIAISTAIQAMLNPDVGKIISLNKDDICVLEQKILDIKSEYMPNELGMNINAELDSDTIRLVKAFQISYNSRYGTNLIETGQVDVATWKALGLPYIDSNSTPDRNSSLYKSILDRAIQTAFPDTSIGTPDDGPYFVSSILDPITQAAINEAQSKLNDIVNEYHPYEWPEGYAIVDYTYETYYKDKFEDEVERSKDVALFFDIISLITSIINSYNEISEVTGGCGNPYVITATMVGTAVMTVFDIAWNKEPGVGDLPEILGINGYLNKRISKALEKYEFVTNSIYKYLVYNGQFLWERGPRAMFIDNIADLQNEIEGQTFTRYDNAYDNKKYKVKILDYLSRVKYMNENFEQSQSYMNDYIDYIDSKYQN